MNGNLFYLNPSEKDQVERLTHETLLSWALALMNSRQKEKFEGGEEVDLGFETPLSGRYRINICQQRSNVRMVCRHIPSEIRKIEELGLPSIVEELALSPRGLLLVTGATGSGKSTTLASIIDFIAKNRSCHIITIEDPIEFSFKDRKSIITQREVGLDTKGFTGALKYALRQDPDVILLGEMRDEETIKIALTAAETGHLVLSTLHTIDATETINRIVGTVQSSLQETIRYQLAATLVGVLSQRLIKRKDGKGRVPAVEVAINNVRMREMITDPSQTHDINRVIEEGKHSGMQSFDQSLMELIARGSITEEEAIFHCSNIQDFQLRLGGVEPGQWDGKSKEVTKSRQEKIAEALRQKSKEDEKVELELESEPPSLSGSKKAS